MTAAERDRLTELAGDLGGRVAFEQPLSELTTWHIGGPAEAVLFPARRECLLAAFELARWSDWPWRVMGNGSNLLCPDEGVRGLVLNLTNALAATEFDGLTLRAEGGAFLPRLAREAAARGLAGLECVIGVPGTVGGGCVMNAGVPDGTIGDVLVETEVLTAAGEVRTMRRDELALGHRESRLQREPAIVLAATLRLRADEPAEIEARMASHMAHRKRTQPLGEATCGSVFRRPEGDYPGRLIEAAGGKGLRCGEAEVSSLHANWIVNRGGATAADVRRLMDEVQARVKALSGIELVPEVIVWSP